MMQTLFNHKKTKRQRRIGDSMRHSGDDRLNMGNRYQLARRTSKHGPIANWVQHNMRTTLIEDDDTRETTLDLTLWESSPESQDLIGPPFQPAFGDKVNVFYGPNVPNYLRTIETLNQLPVLISLALRSPYIHFGTDRNGTPYFFIQPPKEVSVDDCLPKDVLIDGTVRRHLHTDGYGRYVDFCGKTNYINPDGEDVRPIVLMLGFSDPIIQVTVDGDSYRLKTKRNSSISWSKIIRNSETYGLFYPSSQGEHWLIIANNLFGSQPADYLKRA